MTGRSDQLTAANVVQSDVAGTQRLDGLALQRTWEGRLGAILGARYDAIHTEALGRRDAAALSPRLALRYDASRATALRAAFGTGLRAPYLNELVRSFRVGPVLQGEQPQPRARAQPLDPARPRRGRARRGALRAGLHRHAGARRDRLPNRQPDRPEARQLRPHRERRVHGRVRARRPVRAGARLSPPAQHARVTAGSAAQIGKRLAYVPDAAAASLDVERTVRALTGALQISYSGPTFSDDLQRQPLGSALLVGGRLTSARRGRQRALAGARGPDPTRST